MQAIILINNLRNKTNDLGEIYRKRKQLYYLQRKR